MAKKTGLKPINEQIDDAKNELKSKNEAKKNEKNIAVDELGFYVQQLINDFSNIFGVIDIPEIILVGDQIKITWYGNNDKIEMNVTEGLNVGFVFEDSSNRFTDSMTTELFKRLKDFSNRIK